jgi:hypothetical protein
VIFYGEAVKQGVEIAGKNGIKFTLFEVSKPIKGIKDNLVRVYHKSGFEGFELGSNGLVVSFEDKDSMPFAGICTHPFYDISAPPGQSLMSIHETIMPRLGMILGLIIFFAGFVIFYFIKSYEFEVLEP